MKSLNTLYWQFLRQKGKSGDLQHWRRCVSEADTATPLSCPRADLGAPGPLSRAPWIRFLKHRGHGHGLRLRLGPGCRPLPGYDLDRSLALDLGPLGLRL